MKVWKSWEKIIHSLSYINIWISSYVQLCNGCKYTTLIVQFYHNKMGEGSTTWVISLFCLKQKCRKVPFQIICLHVLSVLYKTLQLNLELQISNHIINKTKQCTWVERLCLWSPLSFRFLLDPVNLERPKPLLTRDNLDCVVGTKASPRLMHFFSWATKLKLEYFTVSPCIY